MTDCPNGDIRDLLPDLLSDRLDAAERAEVEAHLRGCVDCQAELELLRSMRSALRRAPAVDVDGIAAGIPPYRTPPRMVTSRSWGGWRIAAAVTLLAAGGTSVVVARHGTQVGSDSARVIGATGVDAAPGYVRVDVPFVNAAPSTGEPANEAAVAPRELALAGGTIGDLDDSELSALIDDIGTLDAMTPADVDNAAVAGPIAPISPSGTIN
jgi:anti-sigma factor RsiW